MKRKITFLALSLAFLAILYFTYPLIGDKEIDFTVFDFGKSRPKHFVIESFLPYVNSTNLLPEPRNDLNNVLSPFFFTIFHLYFPLFLLAISGSIAKKKKIIPFQVRRTYIASALMVFLLMALPTNFFPEVSFLVCEVIIFPVAWLALIGPRKASHPSEGAIALFFTAGITFAATGNLYFNIWNGNPVLTLYYLALHITLIFTAYSIGVVLQERAIQIELAYK